MTERRFSVAVPRTAPAPAVFQAGAATAEEIAIPSCSSSR